LSHVVAKLSGSVLEVIDVENAKADQSYPYIETASG